MERVRHLLRPKGPPMADLNQSPAQPVYERLEINDLNRDLCADIEKRDFAMCVDGRMVTRTHEIGFFTRDDKPVVRVAFEATLEEALHADQGQPIMTFYGGLMSGDLVDVKIGTNPVSGRVHIVGFVQKDSIGKPPVAKVVALTRIYDWEKSADMAARGDTLEVPVAHLRKSLAEPMGVRASGG
jgi:hypothetical protein